MKSFSNYLSGYIKIVMVLFCFFYPQQAQNGLTKQSLFRHNVLVIHSYHKDMQWVNELHDGIEKTLVDSLANSIDIKVEYMDTKRYIGQKYYSKLKALWAFKYASLQPDAIIVCDDNALNFVLEVRDEIFPNIPLVFCGINFYTSERFRDIHDMTGVVEAYDLPGTLDIIKNTFPDRKRLFIINDDTTTGQANKARIEEISYQYLNHFDFIYSGNFSIYDLQDVISTLTPDSAILLMSYNRDADQNVLRYRDTIHAVHSASHVPIFGVWSFYLGKGILGGSLVNGFGQGKTAAALCLRILKGEQPSQIPVVTNSPNMPMFDYKELKKYSVSNSLLPENAIIQNTPDTLWFRYRNLILLGATLLLLQFGIIALLIYNRQRRKVIENRLRNNQQNLAITLEAIGEGVISVDMQYQVTRANDSASSILEMSSEELMNQQLITLLRSLDRNGGAVMAETILLCCQTGETAAIPDKTTLKIKNHPEKYLSGTCSAIRNQNGEIIGAVLICRDITEKESMQAMLTQSQRLEAIGRLAGGVAHDFNNLLTGISGFAELLSIQLKDEPHKSDNANKIIAAASRARNLTRQLLTFARRGKIFNSTVDCHESLQSVIDLLSRSINKNITIENTFGAKHPTVKGDPTQLESVFLNLGINAADAMENGGRLIFNTENLLAKDSMLCEFGEVLEPGYYLQITVSDTGSGIKKDIRSQIFEPFYTLKDSGKGTGLGLSIVYGGVKEHNGRLQLISERTVGTTFKLFFPVAEETSVDQSGKSQPLPKGDKTILVIDDEELILTSVDALLKELGYEVVIAEGGEAGIQLYEERRYEIDFVILDMIMPDMDGASCFKQLKEINPNVNVIISSGFAKTDRMKEVEKQGAIDFLPKPYTAHELSKIIQKHS